MAPEGGMSVFGEEIGFAFAVREGLFAEPEKEAVPIVTVLSILSNTL